MGEQGTRMATNENIPPTLRRLSPPSRRWCLPRWSVLFSSAVRIVALACSLHWMAAAVAGESIPQWTEADRLLFKAVRKSNRARIDAALVRGANLGSMNPFGTTVLQATKDPETLRFLVERGLDLEAGPFSTPPLFLEAVDGEAWRVALLLELGADPNKSAPDGAPPLVLARRSHCDACIGPLIAAGANPEESP